jgi:hypothetical protein
LEAVARSTALVLVAMFIAVALAGCTRGYSPAAEPCKVKPKDVAQTQRLTPGQSLHVQTPDADPKCVLFRLVFWASDETGTRVPNDSPDDLGSLATAFSVRTAAGTGVFSPPSPSVNQANEYQVEFSDHAGANSKTAVYMIDVQASNSLPKGAVAIQVGATIQYEDPPS